MRTFAVIAGLALLSALMARDAATARTTGPMGRDGVQAPGALCSARNAVGVGLRGAYYAQPGWKGAPALLRIDPVVDFDRSLDWPAHVAAARSVRWQGWVKAPLSGAYRFHVDVAGAQVVVARQEVLGAGGGTTPIELQAGRYYPIVVEIGRLDAEAGPPLRLEWTAPHGARYLVPRALLFLPSDAVTPRS